jgi:outer membrane murein-binding lipoprotein Lpp
MDEHTARLEATVNHIQSDVTEMKGDIRRLDTKIDAVRTELSAKIDAIKADLRRVGHELDQLRRTTKRPLLHVDSEAVSVAIYFLMLVAALYMMIADPPAKESHRAGWRQPSGSTSPRCVS